MKHIFRISVKRGITIVKRSFSDVVIIAVLSIAILGAVLPGSVAARTEISPAKDLALATEIQAMQNATASHGALPRAALVSTPDRVVHVSMTAYNSLPEQTDGNPFETAMGTTTRHGIVAANFVPLGTYVKIPELYGDEIFIVEDRMNARYDRRVDIWMEHYSDAKQFGVKRDIAIEVYYEK